MAVIMAAWVVDLKASATMTAQLDAYEQYVSELLFEESRSVVQINLGRLCVRRIVSRNCCSSGVVMCFRSRLSVLDLSVEFSQVVVAIFVPSIDRASCSCRGDHER